MSKGYKILGALFLILVCCSLFACDDSENDATDGDSEVQEQETVPDGDSETEIDTETTENENDIEDNADGDCEIPLGSCDYPCEFDQTWRDRGAFEDGLWCYEGDVWRLETVSCGPCMTGGECQATLEDDCGEDERCVGDGYGGASCQPDLSDGDLETSELEQENNEAGDSDDEDAESTEIDDHEMEL